MQNLVSVIIPTYNRADFIIETVKSVLCQTYQDFEIIIIDDGSTDNTSDLIKTIDDVRLKYIYQKNSGLPASPRNVGIKKAKGNFIAFLDSDDLWLPEKLEKQVEILANDDNIGLVYCNASYFGADYHGDSTIVQKGYSGDVFDKLIEKNFVPALSVMCRREVFTVAGLFDESKNLRAVEDYELWMRIAKYFKLHYIDQVLCRYRLHSQNILGEDKFKSSYKAFLAFASVCNKVKMTRRQFQIGLAANYFYIAMAYLNSDNVQLFKFFLKKSMKEKLTPLKIVLFIFAIVFRGFLPAIYRFRNNFKLV